MGDEFCKPILSKFEVILHIKATNNINCAPLLLTNALNGANNPFFFSFMFNIYDPKTIKEIPINPKMVGNSPTIRGEVINRNKGVKVESGITRDRSANFIAFKYNIAVAIFNVPLTRIANQNPGVISGISIKNNIGIKRGSAKKLSAQATIYSSIFFNPNLPATSVSERNNAVRKAKNIQVIE